MRSFEERKEEIFLRSEKRIKQKKKNRIRVLSIVLPLCICAVGLTVFLNPDEKSADDVNKYANYESYVTNDIETEINYSVVNVITDDEAVKNYTADTDAERVFDISNTLNSYFGYDTQAEVDTGESSTQSYSYATTTPLENETSTKGNGAKADGYEIETVDSNGIRVVFTLKENCLTNSNTGESVALTKTELLKLLRQLGLLEGE